MEACRAEPIMVRNPPHVGLTTVVRLYVCPPDGQLLTPMTDQNGVSATYTSYNGVGGSHRGLGVIVFSPPVRLTDIYDGTSNTLMAGERPPPDSLQAGWWCTTLIMTKWADADDRGPDASMSASSLTANTPCVGPFRFGLGRTDNQCDRHHFWSFHVGGANWLFAVGRRGF
jgi:hypothetical protein